ncbi:MerR family DNA-binding protein [Mesorhizobium kowhaii]|uniref:MerR family DNA-binding protein n=1 Tax=Mesorhizobium kowhaii TaxID=1300272 RepID=UPI000DACB500
MIGLRGRGSIDPVRVLLDLSISASRDCIETRDIAQLHLNQVREKLAALRSLEHRLESSRIWPRRPRLEVAVVDCRALTLAMVPDLHSG